jgi:PAS domain S-box-containing protein
MCLAVSLIPVGIIGGIKGFQFTSLLLIGLILFVTFIVSLVISYFITRPIEKLTQNIDEISKGKLDTNLEYYEIHEINKLTDSLNRVMASLKLAIHKVGLKKGEIFQDALKTKETYEKKQQDFINSIHGWAWETDEKGVFTFCSDNISEWLDYNREEIIGKSIFDLISPEHVKELKNVFNNAIKNKKPFTNFQCHNINKKGEKTCSLINGCPFFDESGDIIGFRGVINDITDLKQ